jgi:hypothetical protein
MLLERQRITSRIGGILGEIVYFKVETKYHSSTVLSS